MILKRMNGMASFLCAVSNLRIGKRATCSKREEETLLCSACAIGRRVVWGSKAFRESFAGRLGVLWLDRQLEALSLSFFLSATWRRRIFFVCMCVCSYCKYLWLEA